MTGCSSGIGRAAALEAAARGHRVYATARDTASLSDEGRPEIRTLPLDVTDAGSIAAAVSAALSQEGRIDALVNNAGFGRYGAVEDVVIAEWRAQFDVNLFGSIAMISAVLPSMREAGSGTIVNVSSVAGRVPIPFASPYCASKHALEAVSDALRVEVAAFGVRVVVVEPGPIESRFTERARSGVAALLARPGPYADVYRNAESAMRKEFQVGVLPPEAVAKVILNAIESKRPRARYAVGRMPKVLFPLKRVLTDRAFDRLMRRALKMR